jgi:hypothetical protein
MTFEKERIREMVARIDPSVEVDFNLTGPRKYSLEVLVKKNGAGFMFLLSSQNLDAIQQSEREVKTILKCAVQALNLIE